MWMKVSLGLTLTWKALALLELLWLQSYLLHKSYLRSSDPDSSDFSLSNSPASITAVISQSHSRTCPSVPSLPSCLVVFQLFQLVKLTEFALNGHSVAAGESTLTSDGLSDSHLCYDVRRSRTSVVLLILFLLLCVNCKPILPPRSSVTPPNLQSLWRAGWYLFSWSFSSQSTLWGDYWAPPLPPPPPFFWVWFFLSFFFFWYCRFFTSFWF